MNQKNKKCPYCDDIISGMSHFKNNHKNINISKDDIYLLMIEKTFNCKTDDIISDYKNGYSLPDIKKKYNISYKVTDKILTIKNIEIRNIKDSCNDNRSDKIRKTSIKKYGVDNISKLENIKEKKKNTFIINYGVDNIFKLDAFKNKILEIRENYTIDDWKIIDEKIKTTNRIRYDVDYPTQNINVKNKRTNNNIIKYGVSHPNKLETNKKFLSNKMKSYINNLSIDEKINYFKSRIINISKLEEKILEILVNNKINFISQFIIENKIFDIFIKDTNILIEVNGDYWHANPNKYKETDILHFPNNNVTALSIWNRDINKEYLAKENNYTVIYLWEDDINTEIKNNNLNDFVIQKIYEKIKN